MPAATAAPVRSPSRRRRFTLYGQRGRAQRVPRDGLVVLAGAEDTALKALCRRLERATRATPWPVRRDCWTVDRDGRVTSTTYEITLCETKGRRACDGYPVVGSLWAVIFAS